MKKDLETKLECFKSEVYAKFVQKKFELKHLGKLINFLQKIYANMRACEEITEILKEEDPVRLINIGAPDDEYASEADIIVRKILDEAESEEDLSNQIYELFLSRFGNSFKTIGPRKHYDKIAERIWWR